MKQRCAYSVFLIGLLALSIWMLFRVDWRSQVSTDVMELIPQASSNPEMEIGRSVLEQLYSKQITILLRGVEHPEASKAYLQTLRDSELVNSVINVSSQSAFESVGRYLFNERLPLFFPSWLSRAEKEVATDEVPQLADYAVQQLETALASPDISAFESIIPEDPLLLMRSASEGLMGLSHSEGLSETSLLLQMTVNVSTLSPEGQQPVIDLLAQALMVAQEYSPQMTAIDTGAHRYASETERHMRDEVKWLNVSTLLIVLVICWGLCRRLSLMLHIFLMLGISLIVTTALITQFFDRLHVFALIFGCVLCGVIIDYGLHAYLHRSESGARPLKTFLRPFLISSGSTLAGFLILVFSDLPVLQQMGAFVSCGLGVASVITIVYVFGILRHGGIEPTWNGLNRLHRQRLWWMPLALILIGVACLPLIHWDDDIRNLKYPLPELETQEAEIRAVHGADQTILITFGESYLDSRAHLSALQDWFVRDAAMDAGDYLNAGQWVPKFEAFVKARTYAQAHPAFAENLLQVLGENGYEAKLFEPFVTAWRDYLSASDTSAVEVYQSLVAGFAGSLGGSLEGIIGENGHLYWWVTLVDGKVALPEIPDGLNTLQLSQVEEMSGALGGYRARTLELSLAAAAMIYVILLVMFRWKAGTLIAAVPTAAVLVSAVIYASFFGTMGIFHLVGLFLGGCLVLDYAVFSWSGYSENQTIPFSVAVSALTTGASFLVLSFSRIVAIHALGASVASVTIIGFLIVYSFVPAMVRRVRG